MKTGKTTVKAILRTDKPLNKEGKSSINLLIYHNGKQIKLSTSYMIEEKDWSHENNNIIINRSSTDEMRFIFQEITKMITDFQEYCYKMKYNKTPITVESIRDHFGVKKDEDFFDYYQKIIDRNKGYMKPDTYRVYKTTLLRLKGFRPNIEFRNIDLDFIWAFDSYLRNTHGNSTGGVFNKHKNLRFIIKRAIEDEKLVKNPYLKFPIKKPQDRLVAMNMEEIQKLEALRNENLREGLKFTLDLFLFACYTGLRFSDTISLEKSNIDWKKSTFTRKQVKTKNPVTVKLHHKAVSILNRYIDETRNLCFPSFSNANTNRNLKIIMQKAHISTHLTFHVARHTFATFLSDQDVNIQHISTLMGHQNIKETMIYAKPSQAMMDNAINKFDF